jgi:hypothetical protein
LERQVESEGTGRVVEEEPYLLEWSDRLDADRADIGSVGIVAGGERLEHATRELDLSRVDTRDRRSLARVCPHRTACAESPPLAEVDQVPAPLSPPRIDVLGDHDGSHDLMAVRLVANRDPRLVHGASPAQDGVSLLRPTRQPVELTRAEA